MRYDYIYEEPEQQSQVLPPGEYDFVIVHVDEFRLSQNETEYLPIKLQIKPQGNVVYDNLVFSDRAKFKIDQLLKSIGKAPAPGTPVNFQNPRWLVGCKGRAKLKVETYQDRQTNRVDAYLYRPGRIENRTVLPPQPMDVDPDNIPF